MHSFYAVHAVHSLNECRQRGGVCAGIATNIHTSDKGSLGRAYRTSDKAWQHYLLLRSNAATTLVARLHSACDFYTVGQGSLGTHLPY